MNSYKFMKIRHDSSRLLFFDYFPSLDEILSARSAGFVRWVKVKGHATDDDIEHGRVQPEDARGKNAADVLHAKRLRFAMFLGHFACETIAFRRVFRPFCMRNACVSQGF
jgi:hypothetical protein